MAQINIVISLLAFFLPLCISYTFPNEKNRCTIYNGGCAFHVLLSGSDCDMVRDAPAVPSYYQKSVQEVQQVTAKVAASKEDEETKESLKKLDSLERKLLKMMEGLSVRSLRHIRQIKTELREVTNAINLMQHQNKRKKGVTCPANFISVGAWSSCYRFSTFNTTWHQAREYCSAFGSDLVSLDTEKESYILDYLLRSNPEYLEPKAWWTSGNYIVRNQKWMWTSRLHLKPITFSGWAPKEPNARTTMHCMMLYKFSNYQWHDAMCNDKNNFICEIELY